VPVYDFSDENNIKYKVVGLKGHIINLDFPKEFYRWNKVDLQNLIQIKPEKKVQNWNIVNLIKKLGKEVDDVIIATDYDREGELIGVEGLELIQQSNPNIKVKRARFSALTGGEVVHAFKNLSEIDYNLSFAAYSRQVIDLKWGAVLTRFISLASKQTGKDFLSAGRVQSPTLALIVDRENEINKFESKPYWQLQAQLKKDKQFQAQHEIERFWDHDEAQKVFDKTKDAKIAIVKGIETTDETEYPPAPFNTTSFLRAGTALKLPAAKVMNIAEELYTNGLISYPRTDNTVYPRSLNLRKIMEMLKKSEFSSEAAEILAQGRLYPSSGKVTATDHPPIHPVGLARQSELKPSHWKVYELVVRRFMATLAPRAQAKRTKADFDINTELFHAAGYEYLEKGWIKYYPYFESKEKFLPILDNGDEVEVIKIEFLEKETKPPKRYSQGSLIQEMDKLGLGTKSTRHEIIQKLYYRGYIEHNVPTPTMIGTAVIVALEKYATTITKPEMTSTLEKDMDEIANGHIEMSDVVKESEEMLDKILTTLEKNRDHIGKSIKDALQNQSLVGKCNICGSDLVVRKSFRGKRFVGCSKFPKCRNSYPLPQNGRIILNGERCELCNSPVIEMIGSKKKKNKICVNMKCESNKNK
jgi:DNA topoisomerase-1